MNLLNVLSQWQEVRHEKRMAKMKDEGACPACYGKGYNMPISEFYISPNYFHCEACEGSGAYADWEQSSYYN
ncbi:methionine aminopeptidase [Salipaludibacillus sp. LMS25]|jgi:excinuclease UvrABC ATPase subunit|uniref:methionine aminopeptidase n=1 Tax=Salipaludibacillus sp. LMS25 TaxID=2924031 RepID=UPI0020D17B69|nr:methionine aminopeptidase [Salipaludibacillus sp. LMS25]UTR15300.1 methionine aminopeptidase [Salipaludibacillus sp. LMS25]